MQLGNGFKLVYEKGIGSARKLYASKQHVPTETDGELDPNLDALGGVKLVYQKDGKIWGSKESYPTPDDTSATITVDGTPLFVDSDGSQIISSEGALKEAIKAGGDVKLEDNITDVKESIEVTKNTSLDLAGKTISGTVDTPGKVALFQVSDCDLTIKGAGTVNVDAYCVDVGATSTGASGNVTIEDGTFETQSASAVQVEKGTLTIKGGSFKTTYREPTYLINVIDGSRDESTVKISGGRFYQFDPSHVNEGETTSFVEKGYKVVKEGDWYVVVTEDTVASASTKDELLYDITNGGDIKITTDITGVDSRLRVEKDTTIDLDGKTISSEDDGTAFIVVGGTLTIKGNGTIENTNGYALYAGSVKDGEKTGNIVVEDGSFKGATTVVHAIRGNVEIRGGTFKVDGGSTGSQYLLNCQDDASGKASIKVTGGKFYQFNPAEADTHDKGTAEKINYVAEGYKAEKEDNDWYVVKPSEE